MEDIKNNLDETVSSNKEKESELFSFNKVGFDKLTNLYQLHLTKDSFDKLIIFCEKFLTNRNFTNIDDVQNLLKLIADLKTFKVEEPLENLDSVKEEKQEDVNSENKELKWDEVQNNLTVMINKISVDSVKERCIKTKDDMSKYIDYLNEKEKQIFLEEESRIIEENKNFDETTVPLDYNLIEEQYKNTWASEIEKLKNVEEINKKKELDNIENTVKSKVTKPMYILKIGDILKNIDDELDYEVSKIYDADKSISEIAINDNSLNERYLIIRNLSDQNVEKIITLKQLEESPFYHNEIALSDIKNQIEEEYNDKISKLINIKKSTLELKKEIQKFKNSPLTDFTEMNNNIDKANSIIKDDLPFEDVKKMYLEIKLWITETETSCLLNE